MTPPLRNLLATTLLAVLVALAPGAVRAQAEAGGPRAAEYMLYQYPDVALVVIVDAREAEFTARIAGPEDALLTEAGVDGRRIGPVWLFVEAPDRPRQLMVRVQPAHDLPRADIGMELIQLAQSDAYARQQAQAYRLLALGLQRSWSDDTSSWAQRVQSLRGAARAFAAMGMERMRLWCEYYAAHRVLHQLDDVLSALESLAAIRAAANRAGFETVAFAAASLEAEALLRGAEKSRGGESDAFYRRADTALAEWARQAGELGYPTERARALYLEGAAREARGDLDGAVERYGEALEAAAGVTDTAFVNTVRSAAAAAHERQGSTARAIGLLDAIAGDLPAEASADADRALTLYEKGRLLSQAFRHAEAAEVLAEALRLQQDDPSVSQWGRTGLALGQALYALGDLEEAQRVLRDALPRSADASAAERDAAYEALAVIARAGRRFDDLSVLRERQSALAARSPAARAFALAEDAAARNGAGAAGVARGFERARDLAAASGETRLRDRAELHRCLHALRAGGSCDRGRAAAARDALARSGVPQDAADGRLAHAQVLRALGQPAAAAREIGDLLSDLGLYRQRLPGVLGAWEWRRRPDVYEEHLALALERAGGSDGRGVLLALEQVRALERALPGGEEQEALRSRIAALQARPDTPPEAQSVVAALARLRGDAANPAPEFGAADLDRALEALGRREALLAWYFGDRDAWLLAATRGDVRLHRLGAAGPLRERVLALVRSGPRAAPGELDRLGAAMLGPAAEALRERVYVLTQGATNGLAVDALRLDGRFLAERSDVVRIESLASLDHRRPRMPDDFAAAVFVAGNPQSASDPFRYDFGRSAEVDAVRDRFVGPGLHIVQGVALDRDEFEDPRFAAAALLHLALPGRIDLAWPDRSRLAVGASFLSAPELRAYRLAAGLAVLGGTAVEGRARTAFDSRVGAVADLHDAGVAAVVASLWPAGDGPSAELAADFYRRLAESGDVAASFAAARRARIDPDDPGNFAYWAGFQLFIR